MSNIFFKKLLFIYFWQRVRQKNQFHLYIYPLTLKLQPSACDLSLALRLETVRSAPLASGLNEDV